MMSIRTIVEINHDLIFDLERHPEEFMLLLRGLKSCEFNAALNRGEVPQGCVGVRVLAQRHHSDKITLKVK